MTSYAWDLEADTVKEILPADPYRDELTVQLHTQVINGADPVFLGFGEEAAAGTGLMLGGIGHSVRALGAKARLAVSALSAAVCSGGIETHTSLEYRHVLNYPLWQKQPGGQEAPIMIHPSPLDGAVDVLTTWDPFLLMFDMNVAANAGAITLFTALDDMPVESVDIDDATVDGGVVSFSFVAPLTPMTAYYIRVDNDVIRSDPGGVAWAGLGEGEWGFTTGLL